MRDRILTPFFPLSRGAESSTAGAQTPGVSARALIGNLICNGRYLLHEKLTHNEHMVRFAAFDSFCGLEIDLELYPDEAQGLGYQVRHAQDEQERTELPNLCALPFDDRADGHLPLGQDVDLGLWERLRQAFWGRKGE